LVTVGSFPANTIGPLPVKIYISPENLGSEIKLRGFLISLIGFNLTLNKKLAVK
jgi:hypothetical protein